MMNPRFHSPTGICFKGVTRNDVTLRRLLFMASLAVLFWACNTTDPEPQRVLAFELKNPDDRLADSFQVVLYGVPRGTDPLKVYDNVPRLDTARISLAIGSSLPAQLEVEVTGFRNGRIHFIKRIQVVGNAFSSAINVPLDNPPKDSIPKDSIPIDTLPKDTLPSDTLPVDPLNSVPLATPDTLQMQEDGVLVFPASDLVKNDRDGDGDPLRVDLVFGPIHGAVTLAGGNITFTPTKDFFGDAGFQYRVTDDRGGRDTANVLVQVAPMDDPPVFDLIEAKSVEEGKLLTFTVKASDPDGDSLVYSLLNPPAGSRFDTLTGAFSWTPGFDQQGVYNLLFEVREVRDTSIPPLRDSLTAAVEVIDFVLPEINFSVASGSGAEGASALVTVALQATSVREIKVRLVSEDITATAGKDFAAMDTVLVFAPGQFSKALSAVVLEDSLNEINERFRLVLKEPVNARVGVIGLFEYTIIDNDPIPANVLCVDSAAVAGGDGKGWGKAFRTVQEALAAAVSGDEIWVAQGTYVPGNSRTSAFRLKSGVALYGGFTVGASQRALRDPARRLTVLSGEIGAAGSNDNVHHVVIAWQATNAILDGFVIADGNALGAPQVTGVTGYGITSGGGLYAAGSGLTLRNCVFRGNRGTSGGALTAEGTLVVGCVFENNTAAVQGGAVTGSRYRIYNSVFHANTANKGGALHYQRFGNTWDSGYIAFSTFVGNVGIQGGGALYIDADAPLEIRSSVLWGNQSDYGSQILFDGTHSSISAWESLVQDRYGNGSVHNNNTSNVQWESGIVDIATGGNPGFVAQGNPAGPDGLWRTADDGLRPGAASPLLDKESQAAPAALGSVDILGNNRVKGSKADLGAYER